MTVAEKILLRCTWLDPAEKEARRLHLQGMTVPDYTVKVRKWFCVKKFCEACGTGIYCRAVCTKSVYSYRSDLLLDP